MPPRSDAQGVADQRAPVVRRRGPLVGAGILVALLGSVAVAESPVRTDDLRTWLTYIASDELQGRGNFSAGLGLAAGYIQDHLLAWHVLPAGDNRSFLQTVRVNSVRAVSRSSVTVQVGRETRTFRDGEDVAFPRNAGGTRALTVDHVEFAGYGIDAPVAGRADFRGRDVQGAVVIWLGSRGPAGLDQEQYGRLLAGRSRHATEELHAAAAITDGPIARTSERPDSPPDFVTTERLDRPVPPAIFGDDAFLSFLFRSAPTSYSELKRREEAQDSLPSFRLPDVTITFTIDVTYEIVRTQLTHNVVGIVEGSDPALKDTYVAFGAHYDHVGYAETDLGQSGAPQPPLYARMTPGANDDRIWNGADDDGSGTVALMALAQAFAAGPRPRRSLLFVWHAGEELGTYGSRFFADYPTVPLDRIVAQLNIDMIGRNRGDDPAESNTVYLVGSDRISSELHEISGEANRALVPPLMLNYAMNDPLDPEQIYYRSDHYSYAAKGIPIIFFTTGLHPDYHASTDDVSRILFDKMARVVDLVYETAVRLANLDHAPVRDNLGPRAGRQ